MMGSPSPERVPRTPAGVALAMHGKQQHGEASGSSRNTTFARAATTKRSSRSFVLEWTEVDGWSKEYDVEQIAREVKTDDWALFLCALDETKAFAEAVNVAREYCDYSLPSVSRSASLICSRRIGTYSPSARPIPRIFPSSAKVSSLSNDGFASTINVMLSPTC